MWVADPISRNSKSVNLLHAVDLLVNFEIQARATLLSKAAVLIRVLVRCAIQWHNGGKALNTEGLVITCYSYNLTAAQESNYAEAGKPIV